MNKAELLEQEVNARKHALYERFMAWYRDPVTEDLILWMLERAHEVGNVLEDMDAHDAISIARTQAQIELIKEIAYGALFRRYYIEREAKVEREFIKLATSRGFDPKADWSEAVDSGDTRI